MFKQADAGLGLAPISYIREQLDRLFGSSEWTDWELETISVELGIIMDDMLRDKIHVLQVMAHQPDLFTHDALFFLYSTEVINNRIADFEFAPAPNSLEIAYAIHEAKKIGVPFDNLESLIDVVSYILRQEGFSVPVPPFEFVPASKLEAGQEPVDVEAKKRAIEFYIKHMEAH